MKNSGIIALITDFKPSDPFIGTMKGVILKINPSATIIDLAHNIASYDIDQAAFKLLISYRYFPRNTIFCCVVDPGVGTSRRSIAIKTSNYYFVGPDNGCLYPAAHEDGIHRIVEIVNKKYTLDNISSTFHGRDIFAPASAYLSLGVKIENLGSPLNEENIRKLIFEQPRIKNGIYETKIVMIDGFGNIILNMKATQLTSETKTDRKFEIIYNDKRYSAQMVRTYGEIPNQQLGIVIGASHGYLEIAITGASAAEKLDAKPKTRLIIKSP